MGFFTISFIGASSIMLIVMGKTKIAMFNVVLSTLVNFILNILLIPVLGIIGAALATSTSLIILSALHIAFCHRSTGLHPFQVSYLKIAAAGLVSMAVFYGIIKFVIFRTDLLLLLLFFPLFLLLYGFLFLKLRGLDKHDIFILKTIHKKSA